MKYALVPICVTDATMVTFAKAKRLLEKIRDVLILETYRAVCALDVEGFVTLDIEGFVAPIIDQFLFITDDALQHLPILIDHLLYFSFKMHQRGIYHYPIYRN